MPTSSLSLTHLTRFPAQSAERYPTVICLHGRGSNEQDLIGLAPYLDERLLWISPRAPLDLMGGYEWYRLLGIGLPDQPTFDVALSTFDQFLSEALAAYPIDPRQLYLLGFSQGSMLSYSYALTQPARLAGVVAQSGYIPLNAGFTVNSAASKNKPYLITHGLYDEIIPVQWGREARDYLQQLGAQVTYHEYPMGHQVSDASLAAIAQWMQAQLDQTPLG